MKKRYLNLIYLIILIILQEVIYHVSIFKDINLSLIYIIIFSICYAVLFYLLTKIFNEKINHILTYVFIIILPVIYIAQLVYHKIYKSIISVYSMFNGGQVFEFINQIINVIKDNILIIIIMIIPLIIYIILDVKKVFNYEREKKENLIILALTLITLYTGTIISFKFIDNNKIYSNYNLYFKLHAPILTVKNQGLLNFMTLDIERIITNFKEKEINIELPEYIIDEDDTEEIEYNQLEIDFDELIKNEKDNDIIEMHNYFKEQSASNKNEYTGMFEGKNVIIFVAEAFSELAIDENLTPNLYRLYKEGFQFDNFYTPLFPVSTADGEYISDTSLIPKEGVWSLTKLTGHYMPYSYANVFESLGYTSQAYHDNTATYYKRNTYIEAMGYDSFKACRAGLNINCKIWPQSDLEMINATVDDYINDEKFLAYYMTVSGHLEYTKSDNMMVTKNWDLVKDLNLSEKAKSYLACNIEFDKSIGALIQKLEENDKLDDTVIIISGDHYPYGLSIDEINELSTYERDENFEIHNMPFLIWNSEMKEPIKVEKYGSSLDVLPTVLNLFGIEYDSRLLMGRDILSTSPGLVIFSNRSFITEKGKYNSLTKEFIKFTDEEVSQEYIDYINKIVYDKFKYSRLILDKDYYRYVFNK